MKQIKNIGRESIIMGISYLIPYIDDVGQLKFKRVRSENVLPFWKDEEHSEVDAFLYWYDIESYGTNTIKDTITKVEYYYPGGVKYFIWSSGQLTTDRVKGERSHYYEGDVGVNWKQVPLIPFKANDFEVSIVTNVFS